jgi:hypothetical protein
MLISLHRDICRKLGKRAGNVMGRDKKRQRGPVYLQGKNILCLLNKRMFGLRNGSGLFGEVGKYLPLPEIT